VGCGIRLVPRRMPFAHYRIPLLSRHVPASWACLAALGGSRTCASFLGTARLPHGRTSASSLGRARPPAGARPRPSAGPLSTHGRTSASSLGRVRPPTAATSQQAGCGYTHTDTCDCVAASPDGRHPPSVVATPAQRTSAFGGVAPGRFARGQALCRSLIHSPRWRSVITRSALLFPTRFV